METFLSRNNIKETTIAVGVSGGADSLALILMAKELFSVYGYKFIALTVDHKLRSSSTQEAKYVAEIMKKHGIEHHILEWNACKPKCGIEEAARLARYTLMKQWCDNNAISSLMVAHHLQDQAETFLMRLQRGSGLEGLCCMREVSCWNGLKILRPLLHVSPDELKNYLRSKNVKWVNDESNDSDLFFRNRLRKFMPIFYENTGIDLAKIDEAITNLQSAEQFIEQYIKEIKKDKFKTDFDIVNSFRYVEYLSWHPEIKFRILADLCKREYIPRADSVLHVVNLLNCLPFNGATLGGKEILLAYDRVWIVPELKAKRTGSRNLWKIVIEQYPDYKNKKLPHKAKLAILQKLGLISNDL